MGRAGTRQLSHRPQRPSRLQGTPPGSSVPQGNRLRPVVIQARLLALARDGVSRWSRPRARSGAGASYGQRTRQQTIGAARPAVTQNRAVAGWLALEGEAKKAKIPGYFAFFASLSRPRSALGGGIIGVERRWRSTGRPPAGPQLGGTRSYSAPAVTSVRRALSQAALRWPAKRRWSSVRAHPARPAASRRQAGHLEIDRSCE